MAFDERWAQEVARYAERQREQLRAVEAPSQVVQALLAQVTGDLGLLRLLLGAPASEVCALLGEAADATERVFALRGTEPAFEASAAARSERDDSLPNLGALRRALRFALACADGERAGRLAALASQATPIASTPAEAALAEALAALVLGRPAAAYGALGRALASPTDENDAAEARALAALLQGGRLSFEHALDELARGDERRAGTADGATDPEVLAGLAARALAGAAVLRSALSPDQLPERLRPLRSA